MLGILPLSPYHLVVLLVPVLLWLATRSYARRQQITIMHNASLAVSYWEEILFRGLAYGVLFAVWSNPVVAIAGSSVLFGLLHLRNLWWAPPKRVIWQCIYAGVFIGSATGILRWWAGDISFAVAAHALNNFVFIRTQQGSAVPNDTFLKSKERQMAWWQRGFIGLGLLLKDKVVQGRR